MARDYTTAGLLESIQNRGQFALNDSTFTAQRVLAMADEEMRTAIIPLVRKNRNDHFVTSVDATTTTATAYAIPSEAMNRGLVNVTMLDDAGREYGLGLIDFDREVDMYRAWLSIRQDWRRAYYVRGDTVHLYPNSVAGETLRLHYERLPNRLCRSSSYTYRSGTQASEAGQITSINTGTGVITCAGGVPSTISTATPICAVSRTPGFSLLFASVTPSGKAATTVTVSTANASLVSVGDWIALDGDSPIVQLPVEAHPLLAQKIAVKLLESMGDEYLASAKDDWREVLEAYTDSFPTRTERASKRVYHRGGRLADRVRH